MELHLRLLPRSLLADADYFLVYVTCWVISFINYLSYYQIRKSHIIIDILWTVNSKSLGRGERKRWSIINVDVMCSTEFGTCITYVVHLFSKLLSRVSDESCQKSVCDNCSIGRYERIKTKAQKKISSKGKEVENGGKAFLERKQRSFLM